MKKVTIIILAILATYTSFAGKETYLWYFGNNAGLDFRSGEPVAFQGQSTKFTSEEACASICDADGNLLFYTNGERIWNRGHGIMQNGDNIKGHTSSTQGATIVKIPGNLNQYYLFTLFSEENAENGEATFPLSYTKIDMSLNSGTGAVISNEKNIVVYDSTTEKATVVMHSNGIDMWLITHKWESNEFVAHLITSKGIDLANPVITPIGAYHGRISVDGEETTALNCVGYMKANNEGTKIALTMMGNGLTEILDFDNETGILSNPISFIPKEGLLTYGLEFSPDDSKLYISTFTLNSTHYIYQYDVTLNSLEEIITSRQEIVALDRKITALQRGLNNKIYVAMNTEMTLGVINEPNKTGVDCGFDGQGIALKTACFRGLPNFIQSNFKKTFRILPGDLALCAGETLQLYTSHYDSYTYEWLLPNGEILTGSEIAVENIDESHEGEYRLIARNQFGEPDTSYANMTVYTQICSLDKEELDFIENDGPLTFEFLNEGDDTITIAEPVWEQNAEAYEIQPEYEYPLDVPPGESVQFLVSFVPVNVAEYNDGLEIEVVSPCPEIKTLRTKGVKKQAVIVWLPDTSASVNTGNFIIPLRAKLNNPDTANAKGLTIDTEIRFRQDAILINPPEYQDGSFVNYYYEGDDVVINLHSENIDLSMDETIIGNFVGYVLLGDADEIPLIISKVTISNPLLEVDSLDGRLVIDHFCQSNLRRVGLFTEITLDVGPLPASSDVNIKLQSEEKGKHEINIYKTDGSLVGSWYWNNNSDGYNEFYISFDALKLQNGSYYVMVRSPYNILTKKLIIMK